MFPKLQVPLSSATSFVCRCSCGPTMSPCGIWEKRELTQTGCWLGHESSSPVFCKHLNRKVSLLASKECKIESQTHQPGEVGRETHTGGAGALRAEWEVPRVGIMPRPCSQAGDLNYSEQNPWRSRESSLASGWRTVNGVNDERCGGHTRASEVTQALLDTETR